MAYGLRKEAMSLRDPEGSRKITLNWIFEGLTIFIISRSASRELFTESKARIQWTSWNEIQVEKWDGGCIRGWWFFGIYSPYWPSYWVS